LLTTAPGRLLGLGLILAAVVAVSLLSLAIGALDIPIPTVIWSCTAFDGSREQIIVQELRVPRTLIGITAGIAFALAGTVMQGLTRNPLADPGILGITSGASLAVLFGLEVVGVIDLVGGVWLAMAGAAIAGFAVYTLGAAGGGGATPIKLAIAGAALASAIGAVLVILLSLSPRSLDEMRFWLVGSIAGRPIDVFWYTLPFVAIGTIAGVLLGRPLNALSMGDELAMSLGMRVGTVRLVAGTTVIVLAGAGVAMAGPIAFLGLAVPYVARAFVGPDWRWVLPYSAILGIVLLLAADIVGRIVVRPNELQVGVVVALVGAPFFVFLVRRRRLEAL
jgi:iron complex transport system permease protein